jgi:hypothetical protein
MEFVFCCPFNCCGNLGLRLPAEVGMSSTMFLVRRLCVPGPVGGVYRIASGACLVSHGYVPNLLCWSRGMDEQVSTGPRSPEYISRLQVFFSLGIIS